MLLTCSLAFNVILLTWGVISVFRIELLKKHRREHMGKITELIAENTRLALKCEEQRDD